MLKVQPLTSSCLAYEASMLPLHQLDMWCESEVLKVCSTKYILICQLEFGS